MRKLTQFWSEYASGALSRLSDFTASVARQRTANDAADTTSERFLGTLTDGISWNAPERLRKPSYFNSEQQFRHNTRADWHGCDRRIMLFAAHFMEAARKKGIPLFVVHALRDEETQNALYAQGRTAPGSRVTNARYPNSPHNRGAAVDIVHGVHAYSLTDAEWQLLGKIGKEVARRVSAAHFPRQPFTVTWGGSWGWDFAHWEIDGWELIPCPAPGPLLHIPPRALLKT